MLVVQISIFECCLGCELQGIIGKGREETSRTIYMDLMFHRCFEIKKAEFLFNYP